MWAPQLWFLGVGTQICEKHPAAESVTSSVNIVMGLLPFPGSDKKFSLLSALASPLGVIAGLDPVPLDSSAEFGPSSSPTRPLYAR